MADFQYGGTKGWNASTSTSGWHRISVLALCRAYRMLEVLELFSLAITEAGVDYRTAK